VSSVAIRFLTKRKVNWETTNRTLPLMGSKGAAHPQTNEYAKLSV